MKYRIALFVMLIAPLAYMGLTYHGPENWKGCPNVTYRARVPIAPEDQRSFESTKFKAQVAEIDRQIPLKTVDADNPLHRAGPVPTPVVVVTTERFGAARLTRE